MSLIPRPFIDDLVDRTDIVEVIDHRVKLKKNGKNYSACCPFHDEKTPSFTVSPDKQFYYCFGCGATGNAVSFLMNYERLSFVDSIESLAKLAGIDVPREERRNGPQKDSKHKKLVGILEKASRYFQEQIRTHRQRQPSLNYLHQRGLNQAEIQNFQLGFAPPGWDNLINALGSNEEDIQLLHESGLTVIKEETQRQYDRFRHRIMFPIRNLRGQTIAFGGRVLGDEKPKYLNSPETPVFNKSKELFGLYEARQSKCSLEQMLVVEGYMDVIALSQFGVHNVVAAMGTACGEEHLRLAFRYTSEIIFCFDGDGAGRTAAKRALTNALPIMEDGRQIKFLFLPDGQDPDSLIRQIGKERFQQQLAHASPLEEFLFEVASEGIDTQSMEGRARLSKQAAPLMDKLPSGVYRELMQENLAKRTGLSREALNELAKAAAPPATATNYAATNYTATNYAKTGHAKTDYTDAPYTNAPTPEQRPHQKSSQPQTPAHSAAAPRNSIAPYSEPQSNIYLTPEKMATVLLLDKPSLLSNLSRQQISTLTQPSSTSEVTPDITRLNMLIEYLQRNPASSFNGILGYWGGKYGLDEQKALAELMANQLLSSANDLDSYDANKELFSSIEKIIVKRQKDSKAYELLQLKEKGLKNLTPTEKSRFRELIKTV